MSTRSFAQPDCPIPLCDDNTFIYGKVGWYAVGDTIQFVGDADIAAPLGGGCGAYKWTWANCLIDTGFTFRKVTNVDLQTCYYVASSTCEVVKAECCALWGYKPICGSCSTCCPGCDLCFSFWRVVAYHPETEVRGCWELEFVDDCDESECESGTLVCEETRRWFD